MKKTRLAILGVAFLSMVAGCGPKNGGGGTANWEMGGIGMVPLLYTSNKEGDCTSIIDGWIASAKEHGVNISGHDNSDPITADNSANWSISYTEGSKYKGKVGILPNQITDMAGLLNEAKGIVAQHLPEYMVVPCFTSEIYKGADMGAISPNTKIGAYNAWYGDATITSLINKGACENVIGLSTSFAMPMIHLLYNELEAEKNGTAGLYGDATISEGNVRNYFYQPWASNDKATYNEMKTLSLDYEIPNYTKAQLDTALNGKTPAQIQTFLDGADFEYIKANRGQATTAKVEAKYKVGVIEMSSSANITKPTKEFYQEYLAPTYGMNFQFYQNDGSDVIGLVNKASQDHCDAVIINCTDTDTVSAAVAACKADMKAAICNMQIYDYNESILINGDAEGKVSENFVGAYGVSLDTWEQTSKEMVDYMFDHLDLEAAA